MVIRGEDTDTAVRVFNVLERTAFIGWRGIEVAAYLNHLQCERELCNRSIISGILAVEEMGEKRESSIAGAATFARRHRRRGRKKGKARNLFERFRDKAEAIVAFF